MSKSDVRGYVSPAREGQAAETRARILTAAERLFRSEGFDGARIDAIAKAAGVSVPTIYGGFKSKRGLLLALLDQARFGEGYRALLDEARGIDDARDRLAMSARIARSIYEAERDTLDLFRGAATVSPELAALVEEREAGRREPQRKLIDDLAEQGQLRLELTLERAADLFWVLTSREVFRSLVVECRWDADAYEAWLAACLVRELCGSPA